MRRVYCDFNDSDADDHYWILYIDQKPMEQCDPQEGELVLLFQDDNDFEVEAVLLKRYIPWAIPAERWVARPNWSTLVRQ